MKIAVTGASGRIGGAVVELAIGSGHEVVAIDRRAAPGGVDTRAVDVRDFDAFLDAIRGCDALVHLAAITGPGRFPDHVVHNTNVVGSYNALRAAGEAGIRRVCQASSVNAIGGRFSREPRYDYLPLDEEHPTHAEDPYSLSKWICEVQGDAMARRYDSMSIASLRFHGVVPDKSTTRAWVGTPLRIAERQLWGYTRLDAAARACVQAIDTDLGGHEAFYIVAPDTMVDTPSMELHAEHYADVPLRHDLVGTEGFFDCGKAKRLLGWTHDGSETT
jgi:nucleoside-diphosphate-sugar epimerase